ncbi:MAG TPA: TIM-barrel domain-containing protein [Casimicrobiaceae bacterium]|nr:TIM-barrel domain-containing protein [Casimicrobiaceae bacterium]
MPFDAASYLRLEAPHCIGTSASGASFATSSGDVFEVTCFGGGVFRVRVGPQTRPDYGLLAGRAKACELAQEDGLYRFRSGDAVLEVQGAPLAVRMVRDDAVLVASITDESVQGSARIPAFGRVRQGGQWVAAFALASGEPVYGLGEKHGSLNKRGQLLHSWVQDAQGGNTGLAHHEVPFAWSPGTGKGAWGLFVHTPGAVIHGIGHPDWSHRSYAVLIDDEALDLFLFAGEAPPALLGAFADLTGHAPEVPRWSLGMGVSRQSYASLDEAAQTIARLRERKLPVDYVMLDGASAWQPQRRFDFQCDQARIPDLPAAIGAIKRHGVRVALWESPYVSVHSQLFEAMGQSAYLLRSAYGLPYVFSGTFLPPTAPGEAGRAPDSALVDFSHPAAYTWWRDAHADLFAAGIDAMHAEGGEHVPDDAIAADGDYGTRLHNVYPLLYARCLHEASDTFRAPDDGPPVVFARAGWTASQRVAVHVAADAQRDWEGLAASIRAALSLGMSGVPLHCAQAPGTFGTAAPDVELALRTLQAAIFASHAMVRSEAAWEPWSFGAETEAIARKWLAFRYRLIPYLDRCIAQARRDGMPVMRAMPLAFPGNALVRTFETQFLCGDALLVAPIVQAGGEVEIALPPGSWFDVNSRQRLAGQRVVRYRAALDHFPVFGREGYVLPLGPAAASTRELSTERPLSQLWVFGKPAQSFGEFAQARLSRCDDGLALHVASEVKVELFGDAGGVQIAPIA